MTEFGSLALVDEESGKRISLPGVRSGDMASRHFKPEVTVNCVQFSPTGRAWVASSTEGILVYSLDENSEHPSFGLPEHRVPQRHCGLQERTQRRQKQARTPENRLVDGRLPRARTSRPWDPLPIVERRHPLLR